MGGSVGSVAHKAAVKHLGESLKVAEKAEKNSKTVLKESGKVKGAREKSLSYTRLDGELRKLKDAQIDLLNDKLELSKAYRLAGGKKQKILDILKFCWGPKAKINREIRNMDHLQSNIEKRMANLDPEKYVQRSRTRLDRAKLATKILKGQLNEVVKNHKADVKLAKKLESFAKASPERALRKMKSFTKDELEVLKGNPNLREFHKDLRQAIEMKADKEFILDIVKDMQGEIKPHLPEIKRIQSEMGKEIKTDKKHLMQRQVKHFFGMQIREQYNRT